MYFNICYNFSVSVLFKTIIMHMFCIVRNVVPYKRADQMEKKNNLGTLFLSNLSPNLFFNEVQFFYNHTFMYLFLA